MLHARMKECPIAHKPNKAHWWSTSDNPCDSNRVAARKPSDVQTVFALCVVCRTEKFTREPVDDRGCPKSCIGPTALRFCKPAFWMTNKLFRQTLQNTHIQWQLHSDLYQTIHKRIKPSKQSGLPLLFQTQWNDCLCVNVVAPATYRSLCAGCCCSSTCPRACFL